jgi:hypothetical protein
MKPKMTQRLKESISFHYPEQKKGMWKIHQPPPPAPPWLPLSPMAPPTSCLFRLRDLSPEAQVSLLVPLLSLELQIYSVQSVAKLINLMPASLILIPSFFRSFVSEEKKGSDVAGPLCC